ncbi:SMP-30/gluconolactonase/LRE family protein [Allosphingosinicella flava]|uniref:SMP-30/gluconolactonase/LRE family protein n=1 Tax=Allosphingosinicella flava TaxID=2771430 RepID=A0A7T2GI83_9SPHN|nr:SMP-30/gluconolactonase/LRE family protein [Sphingosinicella flava]QPQ54350.1 SMP-30/gluconolactonase/LRE family protein [Sphingosinicella flava]
MADHQNGATPICVSDCRSLLGEGPVWVEREDALYWVDIKGGLLLRLDIGSGATTQWTPPVPICSLAPRQGGGFVAATYRGFAFFDPEKGSFEFLGEVEPDLPGNRFNDGKADRRGRFWAGTMDDSETQASGALYRLDPDLRVHRHDEGYRVTNGPAFSGDGRILYHTDSARQIVYAFDLDDRGEPGERRVLARFGEGDGYPDGMTVDAQGCLWIAFWDGWCVRRLSPGGDVMATIALPVQRPTSCAFGGEGLDRLFVTSARIGLSAEDLAGQPQAGGLFSWKPGATGLADMPFQG